MRQCPSCTVSCVECPRYSIILRRVTRTTYTPPCLQIRTSRKIPPYQRVSSRTPIQINPLRDTLLYSAASNPEALSRDLDALGYDLPWVRSWPGCRK